MGLRLTSVLATLGRAVCLLTLLTLVDLLPSCGRCIFVARHRSVIVVCGACLSHDIDVSGRGLRRHRLTFMRLFFASDSTVVRWQLSSGRVDALRLAFLVNMLLGTWWSNIRADRDHLRGRVVGRLDRQSGVIETLVELCQWSGGRVDCLRVTILGNMLLPARGASIPTDRDVFHGRVAGELDRDNLPGHFGELLMIWRLLNADGAFGGGRVTRLGDR
ncbi:uncharacterized protein B0H18DRAFT_557790 [Fomitopsis serialis]|uniref:uncharacterized protein n=1 Tax=Fomitopsis serialis TaxID=139415 RepID=UPI002007F994|nr:uncharacterized protein B0H18DRAFT_557790 [Neoantrodia serialis]KAH9934384.1 hypothetical protein B0H18DRAFT_557790 [Neoantrodia serialis]